MQTTPSASPQATYRQPPEPPLERYARHSRNWLAVIGCILLLGVAAGMWLGFAAAQKANSISSDCVSQGGTIQGC